MDSNTLIPIGVTIVINLLGFAVMWGKINEKVQNISKTQDTQSEETHYMEQTITKLKEDNGKLSVALWGIDGQNGLRGNLKDLSQKVESVRTDMQEVRNQLRDSSNRQERIEERLKDIIDRLDA